MVNLYGTSAVYGTTTLTINSMVANRVPATVKQIVGKNLIRHRTARDVFEWELTINGSIFTKEEKETLLNYRLNTSTSYSFFDGIHDSHYLAEELSFTATQADATNIQTYTLKLVEDI